jgi:hypothetical protein
VPLVGAPIAMLMVAARLLNASGDSHGVSLMFALSISGGFTHEVEGS